MKVKLITLVTSFLFLFGAAHSAFAQGTAFTYQGRLNDGGAPAKGTNYTLTFSLFDAVTNGADLASETITNAPVSNGLFTVTLDFGANFPGAARWLEISVQKNGGPPTTLAPRQPVTPSPYSITAGNVLSGGLSAGTYTNALNLNNPANQFTGNGAGLTNIPGALTPQIVAGTTLQGAPNTSYLLTNNSLVTVTLPAAPNVGDTISIASTGIGGWQLLQNPGQTILGNNLVGANGDWTLAFQQANSKWLSIVSTPDGSQIVASGQGNFQVSHNGGATWTLPNGVIPGGFIVQTADGSQVLGTVNSFGFQISTNFGADFSLLSMQPETWTGIAAASDFSHVVAISATNILLTTGSLTNWVSATASGTGWQGVACSADGSRFAAVTISNGIYISTNFGLNWSQTTAPTNIDWFCVASSADGSHLAAGASGAGPIYTSADFGNTWAPTSAPNNSWFSIASSADGTHLVAGSALVFISADSGADWSPAKLPLGDWAAAASSAIGGFVVGDHSAGGIYLYKTQTTTGASGSLTGAGNTAVELKYAGNGQFLPINHEGTLLLH